MHALSAVLVALLAAAADSAGGLPAVTLKIDGIHAEGDGRAMNRALSHVPSVKVAGQPSPEKPLVLVVPLMGATYDLGDLARAVAKAETPWRERGAPTAYLVLTYKHHADPAKTEAELARTLKATCGKLKGVIADKCQIDTKRKEVYIKVDDKGGATWSQLKAAFPELEVE